MSFYLTFNIWWDNQTFEPLIATEYVEPQKLGSQMSWSELIQPEAILFHYEGNRVTKATQETSIYRMLWDAMQKWQFVDPEEVLINPERGRELLEEYNGLEIIFSDEYPMQFFNNILHLPEGFATKTPSFNRIWVYEVEPSQAYKVLFISDAKRKVIEANLVDLDRAKGFGVQYLMILGSHLTEHQSLQYANGPIESFGGNLDFFHMIYLPVERSDMNQWSYKLATIDIEQMASVLFLDMTAMKEIPERGGSQIFTDGTKSLQFKERSQEMRFYIPVYDQGQMTNDEGFYPVLDFMNHHHGWTGQYRVKNWINDQDVKGLEFREYISGYPIYSEKGYHFGEIMLKYQFNQVNEYARNLLWLESSHSGYQIKIKSSAELLDDLRAKKIYLYSIKQIELGYQAVLDIGNLEAELIPHYIIHVYSNSDPVLIDARVQNMGE